MIELIPFMLFLLGVSPEHPEVGIERAPALYASEAECIEAGKEMVERRMIYREFYANAEFSFRCLPVPSVEEYDDLFKREDEARGQ